MKAKKQWYKEPVVIVALIGLFGTIITTLITSYTNKESPKENSNDQKQINKTNSGNNISTSFDSSTINVNGDLIFGNKSVVVKDTLPKKASDKKTTSPKSNNSNIKGNNNNSINGDNNIQVDGNNNTIIKGDGNVIDNSKTTIINEVPMPQLQLLNGIQNIVTVENPIREPPRARFRKEELKQIETKKDTLFKTTYTIKYSSQIQRSYIDFIFTHPSFFYSKIHYNDGMFIVDDRIDKETKKFAYPRLISPQNGTYEVSIYTTTPVSNPINHLFLRINDQLFSFS